MNHVLLTDDGFFKYYESLGFNVVVSADPATLSGILSDEEIKVVMITETLFNEMKDMIDLKARKAFIPIPDRKNRGAVLKGIMDLLINKVSRST